MRGYPECPECKSKLKFIEIVKSLFTKNVCIKCSNCNTELTIKTKGIASLKYGN